MEMKKQKRNKKTGRQAMDVFVEKFTFREKEKASIREALVEFMEKNPIQSGKKQLER